jgi:sodium transport system permease protein
MIFHIFKKELRETLRDRRTVITMIIVPTLIFPVIMNVFVSISSKFQEDQMSKEVKIGLVSPDNGALKSEMMHLPKELGKRKFIVYKDSMSLIKAIRDKKADFGYYLPVSAQKKYDAMEQIEVKIFHDGTDVGMEDRAESYLTVIKNKWKVQRFIKLKLTESLVEPIKSVASNVASNQEMIGKLAGGFLPYLFIIFSFMGCMYPAIDLFTGEKERMTIETLLTAPVQRWKILIGKMGVVVLSGLLAATCSLLGIFLAVEAFQLVKDPELLKVIHDILSPSFIFLMYLLLIPLVVFFAGVMVPLAIRAKSFKEAQSTIAPMNILVVLPAMVGFFPGIELNEITAMIPIVNIVLATKELIAGTLEWYLVFISFAVMLTLAAIAVTLSYRKFESETNVIA